MKFNPYGLDDNETLLPNPPSLQPPAEKPLQPVAMSLHFSEKGSRLIVTYLNYGIVWALCIITYHGYTILT